MRNSKKAKEFVTDLKIKYEDFYEIANFFDPIYVNRKDAMYEDEVKKIREEDKRKRELE